MTAITPAGAFPKLSDPTSVPAEQPESPAQPDAQPEPDQSNAAIDKFLDKLMMAESGGRLTAKNPRSSALGPYQFINSTFIEVVDRHFPDEVEGLSRSQILALRTDMDFSRRAATAFNTDNADYLRERGLPATFANLRLSYLLGAPGAAQMLRAGANTPLTKVLPAPVIRANPFMRRLTVAGLVSRAEREVGIGTWTISSQVAQSATDFSTSETQEQETATPTPSSETKETSKAPSSASKKAKATRKARKPSKPRQAATSRKPNGSAKQGRREADGKRGRRSL